MGTWSVSQKLPGFRRFVGITYSATFYNLLHAEVLALYLQSSGHLNIKNGGFSPPVHLVFHFFQPNLAYILRFTKRLS